MKRFACLLLAVACALHAAETRRIDNDGLYFQALELVIHGRFAEGRELLRQVLAKNPFHVASRRGLELLADMDLGRVVPEAVQVIASGMKADQEYNWKKALESYRQAMGMAPDYYFLQHNLATCFFQLGQTERAVEEFRKSLRLKENYPYTHNNLGLALDQLGRYPEAVASYRRAISLFPQYHKAYNNLGATYFSMGMEKEGQEMMKKALEINARYTLAFQNFSSAQENDGHPDAEEAERNAAGEPPVPVQSLLETLASGPVLEKKKAQEDLIRRKDPEACPSLLLMLGSPSPLVRAAAAEILGAMQAQEALFPLSKLVEDPEWTVRWSAVKALGTLDSSAVLHSLLAALKDPDYHVRSAAVCAVARAQDTEAFGWLLGMLNDPREEVREACLYCIPGMAAVIPRETILELLRHERRLERMLAVRIVDGGKIPLETTAENASYCSAAGQWRRLEEMGPAGADALRGALDFQDPETRVEAVSTLGRMRGAGVLNHLYYALKDRDAAVRAAACKGLRNLTGLQLKTVDEWLAYFRNRPGNP